jgi:hypothetical protein
MAVRIWVDEEELDDEGLYELDSIGLSDDESLHILVGPNDEEVVVGLEPLTRKGYIIIKTSASATPIKISL